MKGESWKDSVVHKQGWDKVQHFVKLMIAPKAVVSGNNLFKNDCILFLFSFYTMLHNQGIQVNQVVCILELLSNIT